MPNAILTSAIDALASRRDLQRASEAAEVLAEIMHGEASETQIAGFLIALRTKGETVRGARRAGAHDARARGARAERARRPARHGRHRRRAAHLQRLDHRRADRRRRGLRGGQARQPLGHQPLRLGRPAGGARRPHRPRPGGASRAASTRPASASCSRPPTIRRRASSMPVRRELAVRTIFNLLGPLTNPAGARRQLIGVSDASFLETIAGALARLGVERALVVSRRGRARRGLDLGADARGRGQRRGARALHAHARASSGSQRRAGRCDRRLAGRHPERERRRHARDPRRRATGRRPRRAAR